MRSSVIVFPGSNCDRDVARAITAATGRHPDMVWHSADTLPDTDLIVLPGGFSYGDYLRPGAMAAHAPILRHVAERARAGVPVLGICNGFQILTEMKLLPGVLMRNASLRFVCKDVHLRVERNDTVFTKSYPHGAVIRIPIAHHDGNFFADPPTLERLEGDGLVALRYCQPDGTISAHANPNGSLGNIAGILDPTRRILGLMPHPERLIEPALGGSDGAGLFRSLSMSLSAGAFA
jgi:phosphoribosylformylglycinamidine synthase I